ncbi:hypothetical protein HAZT_HAZT005879 [Hyalella azteca]|uniref:Uncharacterized protein n=1 Tax=Hyalella azteca TaxID=294128 RepID=A0A6A0HCV6_HYAAZ|nr:hypothetical protein HAZT_HAZT005879 [Hyalella azteca]
MSYEDEQEAEPLTQQTVSKLDAKPSCGDSDGLVDDGGDGLNENDDSCLESIVDAEESSGDENKYDIEADPDNAKDIKTESDGDVLRENAQTKEKSAESAVGTIEGQIKEVVDDLVQNAAELLTRCSKSPVQEKEADETLIAKAQRSGVSELQDSKENLSRSVQGKGFIRDEEEGLIIEDLNKAEEQGSVSEKLVIKTKNANSKLEKAKKIKGDKKSGRKKGKNNSEKTHDKNKEKKCSVEEKAVHVNDALDVFIDVVRNKTDAAHETVSKATHETEACLKDTTKKIEKGMQETAEKAEAVVDKGIKEAKTKVDEVEKSAVKSTKSLGATFGKKMSKIQKKVEKKSPAVSTKIEKTKSSIKSELDDASKAVSSEIEKKTELKSSKIEETSSTVTKEIEDKIRDVSEAIESNSKMIYDSTSETIESAASEIKEVESIVVSEVKETALVIDDNIEATKSSVAQQMKESSKTIESKVEGITTSSTLKVTEISSITTFVKESCVTAIQSSVENSKPFMESAHEPDKQEEREVPDQVEAVQESVKLEAGGEPGKLEADEESGKLGAGEKSDKLKAGEESGQLEAGEESGKLKAGEESSKLGSDSEERAKRPKTAIKNVSDFLKDQAEKITLTGIKIGKKSKQISAEKAAKDKRKKSFDATKSESADSGDAESVNLDSLSSVSASEKSKPEADKISSHTASSSASSSRNSRATTNEETLAINEPVPFFYYVTPKQVKWRSSRRSDLEKHAQDELKLQRDKRRVSSRDGSCVAEEVTAKQAKEIEAQREAGFFSLPRMVNPSEAYATPEAKRGNVSERSHFSLPRFVSPKSMKQAETETSSSQSGFIRFKNFLLRKDKNEGCQERTDSQKVEGSKDGDPEAIIGSEELASDYEANKESLPKKKRSLFHIGRLHRSEDISSSEVNLSNIPESAACVPEDTKGKSSSLTRPRSLWFGFRDSKDKESPDVAESQEESVTTTKPCGELVADEAETKQRKQRINLTIKGLSESKDKGKTIEKASKDNDSPVSGRKRSSLDSLHRAPSYEIAVSSRVHYEDSDCSPKKSVFEASSKKIKQLFKNQALRNPFSRSRDLADKRKSCPAGSLSDGDGPWPLGSSAADHSSAPDISDRHPSISTFIDDTPVAGFPPVVPASSSIVTTTDVTTSTSTNTAVTVDATGTSKISAEIATTTTVDHNTSALAPSDAVDLDEPPTYPPPSVPCTPSKEAPSDPKVDIASNSEEAEDEEEEDSQYDHQPSTRSDWTKSLEQSLRRTLERKLTFSLPPDAPDSVDADVGVRPVERAIEARQQSADYLGSMVRCLHLSKCFIANSEYCPLLLRATL